MLLQRTEVLSFNYGLSVAKYRHRLLALKINNISIDPKKCCQSSSASNPINQSINLD